MLKIVYYWCCIAGIVLMAGCIDSKKAILNYTPDPTVRFDFIVDSTNDQTILKIIPYGNINIPGEWTQFHYQPTLHQHFFRNEDSTNIGIAKNPVNRYPFYDKSFSSKEFVTEYIKWDLTYWRLQGMATRIYKNQSEKGYVIWMALDPETNIYSVLLYGTKNSYAYHLSVSSSKWSDEEMVGFLTNLFNNN